jgi:signal peptidase I
MIQQLNRIFKYVFWTIIVWLVIRVFLFQSFNVPGISMKNNLNEGDYIIVNKSAYGARIPTTPFSIGSYFINISLPYVRIPGYSSIKKNDILVFNTPIETDKPIDHRTPTVKRCIAIAGENIRLKNGQIYINDRLQKCTVNSVYPRDGQGKALIINSSYYSPQTFPNHPKVRWNNDQFGPLKVPKKGQTIVLNSQNLLLYGKLIVDHEDKTILTRKAKTHTFQLDYYFVMGDNRSKSIDSRSWGFVPESHVIGKVEWII